MQAVPKMPNAKKGEWHGSFLAKTWNSQARGSLKRIPTQLNVLVRLARFGSLAFVRSFVAFDSDMRSDSHPTLGPFPCKPELSGSLSDEVVATESRLRKEKTESAHHKTGGHMSRNSAAAIVSCGRADKSRSGAAACVHEKQRNRHQTRTPPKH